MKVAIYLDIDCDGNDLLDNVGNNISAGWYVYDWPFAQPIAGPFEFEYEAIEEGSRVHDITKT